MNFWLLICPDWLCFDWSFGSIELVKIWFDVRVIAIFLFNVYMLQIILSGSRWVLNIAWLQTNYLIESKFRRNVLVTIAMLFIPFLPASGIISLGFVIAERILYIPSIGYCLLVCIGFNRFYEKYSKVNSELMLLTSMNSYKSNMTDFHCVRGVRLPSIYAEIKSTG